MIVRHHPSAGVSVPHCLGVVVGPEGHKQHTNRDNDEIGRLWLRAGTPSARPRSRYAAASHLMFLEVIQPPRPPLHHKAPVSCFGEVRLVLRCHHEP